MMLYELGKRLEAIRFDRLPRETVDKAKTTIMNFFAGGLAGADAPLTLAEKAVWESQGSSGNCVVVGHPGRLSPLAAASVNALMGQIFLLEDCHEATISHPGVVVIPVALALGQSLGVGGMQIIEAVVAGYESIGRIGSVLIAPGFPSFGLRPASTLAPLGGAAAAAKILGLTAAGIADAIAIAGNTASGVMEFVNSGTADICMQNSIAARNGVMAALLAARGVRAAPTILDGTFGLGRAMNRQALDWSAALAERHGFMIDDSFIKRYPGCGHVLATAQAAASLAQRYRIDADSVEKVTVGVSKGAREFPGVDYAGPFSGTISAMMSHQFMVASTLVHGEVTVDTVRRFDDPRVAEVARKVSVHVDEAVDRAFPHKTGARLQIRLKTGDTLVDFQEDLNPLNRDEVIDRFWRVAKGFMPDDRADEIVEITLRLERLNAVDSLMSLLEA